MGTWVTCPYCIKNLPRKYKNRKERKIVHQATCTECKNKSAQKDYERGVKRGIWLKKWKRAIEAFNKTISSFDRLREEESKFTVALMGLMCDLRLNRDKDAAQRVLQGLTSGQFDFFLGSGLIIPEFSAFEPLYYEAKGWQEFFKIGKSENLLVKVKQMKKTSHEFFNMGYGQLYFSSYFKGEKLTNVEVALRLEAESEEILGNHYASILDIDKASIHLSNAASAYINLEETKRAKQLKMVRQSLRMETACWVCGSRSKGHRQSFNFKYTGLNTDNHERIMGQLKQRQERNPTLHDNSVYTTDEPIKVIQGQDVKDKKGARGVYLSVCITCQGLLDHLARDVVEEALIPVWRAINTMQSQIESLNSRVGSIEHAVSSLQSAVSSLKSQISALRSSSTY